MKKIELRNWQKEAVNRSGRDIQGIFLEALGGHGKTICALAICHQKQAKRVMILNNMKLILRGWKDTIDFLEFEGVEFVLKTDKWLVMKTNRLNEVEKQMKSLREKIGSVKLSNKNAEYKILKAERKSIMDELNVDVLVVDEWQNMCGSTVVKAYSKIKRSYTIGLSATPIRRKGQNFFPLEKVVFGYSEPSDKLSWNKYWGQMKYDSIAFSKEVWEDFRDYEDYISRLDKFRNFMRWEHIDQLENKEKNNGFKVQSFRPRVYAPTENLEKLETLRTFNIVEVNGEYVMPKALLGVESMERALRQAIVEIDFPKLTITNAHSPLMKQIQGLIERTTEGLLIVGENKAVVRTIFEQSKNNPKIKQSVGLLTGDDDVNADSCTVLIATNKKIGVGIDGFQYRFKTIVSLDPVPQTSGKFNDYLQLLWRVIGNRQTQDVSLVEFVYLDNKKDISEYEALKAEKKHPN